MNNVSLIGNLVGNPELGTTTAGKRFSKFTVAISMNKEETSFIPCVAWNETAESIVKFCKRGSKVGISGKINQRQYDNRDGARINVVEVIVDRCDFLTKLEQPKEEETIKGENLANLNGDDLPF